MMSIQSQAWLRPVIAHLSRTLLAGAAIAFTVSAAMSPAQGAENKLIGGDYKLGPFLSMNTVTPVDKSDHVLVQFVRSDRMTSGNPDFNFDCTLSEQDDQTAAGGKHHGISNCLHKSGDRVYYSFEGTHKVATEQGGSWKANFEGTMRWLGGTGKFQKLTGTGSYKGSITPEEGGSATWQGEVAY